MTETATTSLNNPGFKTRVAGGNDIPINIAQGCNVNNAERYAHCAQAIKAGFPVLMGSGTVGTTRPCVLVGTGFSALGFLADIKQRYDAGEEIIAIKGAHDWLIANGIKPAAAIAMDAQRSRAKCFRHPQHGVLYLCASQMHPATWKHMRGARVLIWHSTIDGEQHERKEFKDAFLIPSASCTGNSAMLLMNAIGRFNFQLYGFDASMPVPETMHDQLRPRTKLDGTRASFGKQAFEIVEGGRSYWATSEMVLQAREIATLMQVMDGVSITAHGEGLYQARIRTMIAGPAAARFQTSGVRWAYAKRA